ncbi:unnamed protein product [Brachionus calyciflorus]|uniref:Uncharacterized protein n=1 Tax=Brachionus calyciflorus TaxID=104777 RepID=A0A813XQ65_9BILA|nr:unnamed protein product [Brachionus calyciflorus]
MKNIINEKNLNEKSNYLNNQFLSSSFSHDSSLNEQDTERLKLSKASFDESEPDSRQELVFHSIASDNSYFHEIGEGAQNKRKYLSNKNSDTSNNKSDIVSNKTLKDSNYTLMKEKLTQKGYDETIRGNGSTTYNPQIGDSLSNVSDKKKKIIVRVVTVFSIVFFLICFAMIAFTLRMSEKIDAQIRKGYSGYNFNALSVSTRSINPQLISQNLIDKKVTKIIQKLKLSPNVDSIQTPSSILTSSLKLLEHIKNSSHKVASLSNDIIK